MHRSAERSAESTARTCSSALSRHEWLAGLACSGIMQPIKNRAHDNRARLFLILAGMAESASCTIALSSDAAPSGPTHRDAPADDGGIIGLAACRQGACPRRLSLPATIEAKTSPHALCFDPGRPSAGSGCLLLRSGGSNEALLLHTTLDTAASCRPAPGHNPQALGALQLVAAHRQGGATDGCRKQ